MSFAIKYLNEQRCSDLDVNGRPAARALREERLGDCRFRKDLSFQRGKHFMPELPQEAGQTSTDKEKCRATFKLELVKNLPGSKGDMKLLPDASQRLKRNAVPGSASAACMASADCLHAQHVTPTNGPIRIEINS